MTGVGRKK